jgi:predicted N-formylglutamate amidohydrolase
LDFGWKIKVSGTHRIAGSPKEKGVFIICDHAINFIPEDIDLGINQAHVNSHIALDIGVAGVADILVHQYGYAAILAGVSRLVVDLNRYAEEDGVIPSESDGVILNGNKISAAEREERLKKYYHPYHAELENIINQHSPAMLLSLHSFTPQLSSRPDEKRPWEIGILYNRDERAARLAIPEFEKARLIVGDQLPYSGKILNATMNRHGEGNDIPYLGIEMRQDLVSNESGQARFAAIIDKVCQKITEKLAIHSKMNRRGEISWSE